MADERKTLAELSKDIGKTVTKYQGRRIRHIKSGDLYCITGAHYRESDMAQCIRYSPLGEFFTLVEFERTVEEMEFGERFELDPK